jgi:hypothetical protein
MIAKHRNGVLVLLAALAAVVAASDASAQCCGATNYGAAYQTYSPVTYTAYQPVASSWYPGCCLTNWWRGMWGSGYTAAYAPAYTSYRPVYYASYPTTTHYAPASACTTCTTGCDPCSSCSVGGVSQAAYQDSGCSTCGVSQAATISSPPSSTYPTSEPRPTLAPSDNPPVEREVQRPVESANEIRPEPQSEVYEENASFFEPPRLFNPKDQTAARNAEVSVRTAVYEKPVAGQQPITRTVSISRAEAERDATGWSSARD